VCVCGCMWAWKSVRDTIKATLNHHYKSIDCKTCCVLINWFFLVIQINFIILIFVNLRIHLFTLLSIRLAKYYPCLPRV